jgi:ATP-dependent Lhr-like helicase
MGEVLLGTDPSGVVLSGRARAALGSVREEHTHHVAADSTVLLRSADGDVHWWTWAGAAANRMLHASLEVVDPQQRLGDRFLRLRHGIDLREAAAELRGARVAELVDPPVDARATRGLRFSAALPEQLATATLAQRLGDRRGAELALREDRTLIAAPCR